MSHKKEDTNNTMQKEDTNNTMQKEDTNNTMHETAFKVFNKYLREHKSELD